MSKRDHVTPSLADRSRGVAPPTHWPAAFTSGEKRKNPSGSEPTSDTNKRAKGISSNASGLTSLSSALDTILEVQPKPTALPARPPPGGPVQSERKFTPLGLSTSNTDHNSAPLSPPNSLTRRYLGRKVQSDRLQQSINSNTTTQVGRAGMEDMMKHELFGHVFLHKKFFAEFLEPNATIQDNVRQLILSSPEFASARLNFSDNLWGIDEEISLQEDETLVYTPLAKMLNVIGRVAHANYASRFPNDQFRQNYRPFHDHSDKTATWDYPSDASTKPDLVKAAVGRGGRAHWGDVELVIECKSSASTKHRNDAYLQLARYARTVFAHQVYRLRVFGFSLCGSIVNFVCFDRSGLLHSSDVDLSTKDGADSFVRHMITLLTIDSVNFGYDTRYSFGLNSDQELVDTRFHFPGTDHPEVVSEVLCHRKCCCGRATCVCALGDDVHKGIWRPTDRADEGETLALFEGVFGVCQVKAFSYGVYTTELRYPEEVVHSPSASFFYPHKSDTKPPASTVQSVCSKTTDAPSTPADCTSDSPKSTESAPAPTTPRVDRVKSDILMLRGVSLFEVQNSLHLLMAIHDALMGIMALTEAGKIHCDISAFNLLLVNPEKHYKDQDWLKAPKTEPNPAVWDRTAKDTDGTSGNTVSSTSAQDEKRACPRLTRVKELKRGPVCVVHDTEFTIDEDRPAGTAHTDRTGTPAFISGQLLSGYATGEDKVTRTFIHDVESLFWVLVWVVAHRSISKDSWRVGEDAAGVLQDLSQPDFSKLGRYKRDKISGGGGLRALVQGFGNDLCEDLAPVIGELANFLSTYLYFEPQPLGYASRFDMLRNAEAQLHKELTSCSRGTSFSFLFDILDPAIAALEAKHLAINFGPL
ncbi:hypothetical protein FRC09_019856 [Ceratobasidium sp. 395]|nr:hypothetical protein FRC09_019856 [Ceratobasidium sp. 395]